VIPLPAQSPGEPGPSFTAIVESAARAAAGLVGDAANWWTVPSTSLLQPAVYGAHSALRPLLLLVLTGSVAVQVVRIAVSRRGEPALTVIGGLLRFAVTAALGVTVLQCALLAGDALAVSLVGDSAEAFGATMREALTTRRDGLAEPFLLLLLSVLVLLLAAAQWMAMAMRQVALLAVAATLPLAAAGSLTAATRTWLTRLLPWGLALVIYKPAAALIHAVGRRYLTQIADGTPDHPGSAVAVVLAGIVVLALGVAALPVSLRLLSFAVSSRVRITGGGFGGEAMSGAVGAVRLTGRSSTSPSVQLATYMESAGPGSTGHPLVTPRPMPDAAPVPREQSLLEPALTHPFARLPAESATTSAEPPAVNGAQR
jgi:hypothetical protein